MMAIPLKPLHDRVLVAVESVPVSAELWTPASERPDVRVGRVAMIGQKVSGLLPGDRVMFPHLKGAYLKIDGEPYALVYEHTILGVLEEAEDEIPA